MTEKRLIQYKVLCDDYEEVRRILFEIIETGEEIEGYHQIQEWVDNLYKENEQLKQSLSQTSRELQYGVKKVQKLAKENEQLKSEIEKLENKIEVLEGKLWNCQNIR